MKKKEFLTEAKRKAIISDKEKAIIESFAKTFNKIKRIDENSINEFEEENPLYSRQQEYGINPEIEPNQFNDNDEVEAEMRFKDVASVYSANPPHDHIAAYKLKINDVDVY